MEHFQGNDPCRLAELFGSPLYVYNEGILRERCREMMGLVSYPRFRVHYSAKANSSIALLQIIRSEGLNVDAMTPGEIHAEMLAGFTPDRIMYVSNNVSAGEMEYAAQRGILVSVDSISQLELYGGIRPGGKVAVRFNPGFGAGHHEKVITAGAKTKFGVQDTPEDIARVKQVCAEHGLTVVGLNMHVGSNFMEADSYLQSSRNLARIAKNFDELDFIDLGGGFGIPYNKQEGQARLDLAALGKQLDEFMHSVSGAYGRQPEFKIEPGRYVVAECGVLLGRVHAVKTSHGVKYVGTDIGFNVLARPMMYGSYHDIKVCRADGGPDGPEQVVTVSGNICESGDVLAADRKLPQAREGDVLCVMDAGAYGHAMSSNYTNRLRPAEVLVRENSEVVLIRERDSLEDLTARHKLLPIT
ncbi:MAG: diaminopimelate decarboxylase [Defluviitaleaceae bacterium]|nr:diaminopimelate decarboxylase [Defluviitaleaceae bacterium]